MLQTPNSGHFLASVATGGEDRVFYRPSQNCVQKRSKAILRGFAECDKLIKRLSPAPEILCKVQHGAFSKLENAEKLAEELKGKGYQVTLRKHNV